MMEVERLQGYLRHSAARQYEAVALPAFTFFYHAPDSLPHFNYAIPDRNVTEDAAGALAALRATCAARGRVPRLEYVEAFAPRLGARLAAAGYAQEGRYPLMVCTPETLRAAPPVADLAIVPIGPDAPLPLVRGVVTVQRRGFGAGDEAVSDEDAERFRPLLTHNATFLGRWAEEAVCVASYSEPYDGLVEIAGIATIPPYRRRGLASALTGAVVTAAFARGVVAAFLSAADERAGRIYQRLGFQPFAHLLAYRLPDLPPDAT